MRARLFPVLILAVAAAVAACGSQPAPKPAARPNVLLITIDTLRADRLGRGLTPALDRLAARGLRFTNARATVPLTLPSHATILTGLLPTHHGVRLNGASRLRGHQTLATTLKAAGYSTGAVVGAFVLNRQFGLGTGFDVYDDRVERDPDRSTALEAERRASAVTDAALAAAPSGGGPWFLWVHYYDPHAPYAPPRPAGAAPGTPAGLYDGEVAYVDAEIARLLDGLRARPAAETLVVVAGDHGESLGEHGEATHGMLLYDGALRVPLVVSTLENARARETGERAASAPALGPLRPGVRAEPVSLVDVAPTILGRTGVAPAEPMDGIDLLGAARADRELYAETQYPVAAGWSPLAALVGGSWKLVEGGRLQLFDLASDGAERHDLSSTRVAIASGMRARLRTLSAGAESSSAPLTSEARERLRALGYITPSSSAASPGSAPDPADRIADWTAFETASADLAAGRRTEAVVQLGALGARNPAAQAFHTTRARALAESGRRAEALQAYRDAASRWPGDAVLLHDLAVAARDAGQAGEALRAEHAALTIDPSYAAALNGVGLLHADQGRVTEAADAFERAAALDRSDPACRANLGNARRALGNLEAAREAYQSALAIDGTWPDAANGIGALEVQAGRAAQAVPWFEKALARSPGFVEARLNLGIAWQEAGQAPRARAEYLAVLQAPPAFARERAAARELLRGLRR